jgi:Leu/Phe-tRNA-protein transferase
MVKYSLYIYIQNCTLCILYKLAKENSIKIIDCQVYNKHLESLGAYEISREEYFKILKS